MKKIALPIFSLFLLSAGFSNHPAIAMDISATPVMQACSRDTDCTIADGQCGNACSFVPLNTKSRPAFETQKTAACGAPSSDEPKCQTVPPLSPSCIHNRCTIGTAYQDHASAADYDASNNAKTLKTFSTTAFNAQTMAAVMPAAGDNQMSVNRSESRIVRTDNVVNSRNSFTAYDLPDRGASTSGTLGTIRPSLP